MTHRTYEIGQVVRLERVSTGMECFDQLENSVGVIRSISVDSDGDEWIGLRMGNRTVPFYTHQITLRVLGTSEGGDAPPVPSSDSRPTAVASPAAPITMLPAGR